MAKIVLVDDHSLLRNGLSSLVKNLGHTVLFEADNGKDFIEKLSKKELPDVVLLDINMPIMDGYETAAWLKLNFPQVNILSLSMYDNESAIIRMLNCGARGYILKDSHPKELKKAIELLMSKGFYYTDLVNDKLVQAINKKEDNNSNTRMVSLLTEREIEFLKNICTELTYKEIAEKMQVSPRTVDGYRDALFDKTHVKTRVGLVIFAIKNGLFVID